MITRFKLLLIFAALSFQCFASDVRITYNATTTRTDGNPIIGELSYRTTLTSNGSTYASLETSALQATFPDVPVGSYQVNVYAIEDGRRGADSEPVIFEMIEDASPPVTTTGITVTILKSTTFAIGE